MNSFRDQNVEAGRQQRQQLRAERQAGRNRVDLGRPEQQNQRNYGKRNNKR